MSWSTLNHNFEPVLGIESPIYEQGPGDLPDEENECTEAEQSQTDPEAVDVEGDPEGECEDTAVSIPLELGPNIRYQICTEISNSSMTEMIIELYNITDPEQLELIWSTTVPDAAYGNILCGSVVTGPGGGGSHRLVIRTDSGGESFTYKNTTVKFRDTVGYNKYSIVFVTGEGADDDEAAENKAANPGLVDNDGAGIVKQDNLRSKWGAASCDLAQYWEHGGDNSAPLNFLDGDFTISAWTFITAYRDSIANRVGGLVQLDNRSLDSTSTCGATMWDWNGGTLAWDLRYKYGPGEASQFSQVRMTMVGQSWPLNTWRKVSFTRFGTSLELHVDGTRVDSVTLPADAVFRFNKARALAGNLGSPFLGAFGSFDNFQVVDAPLYTGPNPVNHLDEETLIASYPPPE